MPVTSAPEPKPERVSSGNPLWAIPLRQLSATVARPLFAPSRRPPPPVVADAPRAAALLPPPKAAEPDKPDLSLLGTVAASSTEGIGIFVEQGAGKNVLRLKIGENHKGWVLRTVQRREVAFEKSGETVVLAIPSPEMKQTGPFSANGASTPGPITPGAAPASPAPSVARTPPKPAAPAAAGPPPLSPDAPAITAPAAAPISPGKNPFEAWFQRVKQQAGGPPEGVSP
jgi:general secretion pathway protein N